MPTMKRARSEEPEDHCPTKRIKLSVPELEFMGSKIHLSTLVAHGNCGRVYKGTYCEKPVAVKIYKLTCAKPFVRECECLIKCSTSKRTLNIVAFGRAPCDELGMKEYFLVTQYCGKQTLQFYLDHCKHDLWQNRQRIMLELLEGLQEIHSLGICHHDIKPDNILMAEEGQHHVRYADFGFATHTSCPFRLQGKGSILYSAPEVFLDDMQQASDVWSLGVVLYEMCMGVAPFDGNHESIIRKNITEKKDIEFANHVPEAWQYAISHMLAKDADKRISVTQILKYLSDHGVSLEHERKNMQHTLLQELNAFAEAQHLHVNTKHLIHDLLPSIDTKHHHYNHHHHDLSLTIPDISVEPPTPRPCTPLLSVSTPVAATPNATPTLRPLSPTFDASRLSGHHHHVRQRAKTPEREETPDEIIKAALLQSMMQQSNALFTSLHSLSNHSHNHHHHHHGSNNHHSSQQEEKKLIRVPSSNNLFK